MRRLWYEYSDHSSCNGAHDCMPESFARLKEACRYGPFIALIIMIAAIKLIATKTELCGNKIFLRKLNTSALLYDII